VFRLRLAWAPDADLGDGDTVEANKEPVVQAPTMGTHQSKDEGQQERWGDEESTDEERQGRPLIPELVPSGRPNGQVHNLANGETVQGPVFDVEVGRDLVTACHCILL